MVKRRRDIRVMELHSSFQNRSMILTNIRWVFELYPRGSKTWYNQSRRRMRRCPWNGESWKAVRQELMAN